MGLDGAAFDEVEGEKECVMLMVLQQLLLNDFSKAAVSGLLIQLIINNLFTYHIIICIHIYLDSTYHPARSSHRHNPSTIIHRHFYSTQPAMY